MYQIEQHADIFENFVLHRGGGATWRSPLTDKDSFFQSQRFSHILCGKAILCGACVCVCKRDIDRYVVWVCVCVVCG